MGRTKFITADSTAACLSPADLYMVLPGYSGSRPIGSGYTERPIDNPKIMDKCWECATVESAKAL